MPRNDLQPRPHPSPWLGPPRSAPLADDHAVDLRGDALVGKRVALLVCGGIAAFKAPLTIRALRRQGAEVTAFMSAESERYVTEDTLAWASTRPVVKRLSAQAEHLSGASPFDAYLVAPATYNTINKLAVGIADTVLTATLASAIGRMERGAAAVLVAPTMHGTMHNSILTASLERLSGLGVRIVPPRDAYGKDNIPEEAVLVAEVCASLVDAPMRGKRFVVVGGPDALGQSVAVDLIHRGAAVLHVQLPTDVAPSPVSDPLLVADGGSAAAAVRRAEGPWDAIVDATGGGLGSLATVVVSVEGSQARVDGGALQSLAEVLLTVRSGLV